MFSYEEMKDVSQNYRVKLDLQTNQFNFINIKTKEILEPSDETNRIKALLIANQTVQNYVSKWMLQTDKEGHTIEEIERKCLEELQNSLIEAGTKGEHACNEKFSNTRTPIVDVFFWKCIPRNGNKQYPLKKGENFEKEAYKKDSAIQLLNLLLAEKGKKVENIKDTKFDNRSTAQIYQLDSRELTMQEKLNPNNPMYTQISVSRKQLSPEQRAKRRAFVEELIKNYLMFETDELYQERAEKEENVMQYAVKNCNNITLATINIPKIMRLLLAAKDVSLEGQRDYLEEIISQPQMNAALLTIKDSEEYKKIIAQGQKNKEDGKIINGHLKGHHETIGERDSRIANSIIQKFPDSIMRAKQNLSLGRNLKFDEERKAIFHSAVARSLGKIPSYTELKKGEFSFSAGDEKNR